MFHFPRYKSLFLHFNSIQAIRIQPLRNPSLKCHYQTNPPSSLCQYLQTSLGFSPERALALSQQVKGRNPNNRDAVLTFFKSHGLSRTQIKSIIDRAPLLLSYVSPESMLMPKIEFFRDKGISESDLVDLMVSNPRLLAHSLESYLKPMLDLLRSLMGTDEFAVKLLIRSKLRFNAHILSTNLSILRSCGVQNHHLLKLFAKQPQVLNAKSDRFSEVVEMVKGMGFKPQSSLFVKAVFTIISLRPQTWNAKFKLYASLGWSAEEIPSLFCKQPLCMSLSEDKIRKNVDYLTKELGWGPPYISMYPTLLGLSLEKRIITRHRFLQFLASKGLIKKHKILGNSFMISEKVFLKNFLWRYESKVPDILKIYEDLTGSKLLNIKEAEGCSVQ